jgi:hypothetical protein
MAKRVRLNEPKEEPKKPTRVRLSAPAKVDTPHEGYSGGYKTPYPRHPGDEPRECTLCENVYWEPCDGKDEKCMNKRFHAERTAGERKKRRK